VVANGVGAYLRDPEHAPEGRVAHD
jgi:hypothetical protein